MSKMPIVCLFQAWSQEYDSFAVRTMTRWRGTDTVPTKPQKMAEAILMLKNMVMRSKK